ncbi:MAG TPA: hypothetical protein VKT80_10955, partial [Chloroflexota bacterium]|nr:hypothetical protein [Chloroflexota bacterium]
RSEPLDLCHLRAELAALTGELNEQGNLIGGARTEDIDRTAIAQRRMSRQEKLRFVPWVGIS